MPTLSKKDSFDFTQFPPTGLYSGTDLVKWKPLPETPGPGNEITPEQCMHCLKETKHYCKSCLITPYCGEKCWKADQAAHLIVCGRQIGITLSQEEITGYPYYIFCKDHPKGKLILGEEPFTKFPVLPLEYEKDDGTPVDRMICFTCHKFFYPKRMKNGDMDYDSIATCSQCGLFKCGKICAGAAHDAYHTKNECCVLQKFVGRNFKSYLTSKRKYSELYFDICVLRVLCALSNEPICSLRASNWRKFMLLSTTARFQAFKRTTPDYYDGICYMKILKKSVEPLKYSMAFAQNNEQLLRQVLKTMLVFWEEFESSPGEMNRLLFLDRHFIAHSYCSPNVELSRSYYSRDAAALPNWIFYLTKAISINDVGSSAKVKFDFSPRRFMPICLRMIYLNDIGLQCSNSKVCNRCDDPSDSGTHSGSIRCTDCYKGIYVEYKMRDPVDQQIKRWTPEYIDKFDWKCNECSHVVPFSLILKTIQDIEEIYKKLILKSYGVSMLVGPIKFVDLYENSYLHPNNGLILQAKYDFLMAARERHFKLCLLDMHGFKLPYLFKHIGYHTKSRKYTCKIKLLPVKWDQDELLIVRKRADYSFECREYLELTKCRNRIDGTDSYSVDYTFLSLESGLMRLLVVCYFWLNSYDDDVLANEFMQAGRNAVELIHEWEHRRSDVFNEVYDSKFPDPLLKWPGELLLLRKMVAMNFALEPNKISCFLTAKGILQEMGVSAETFLMGKGKLTREIVGDDDFSENWPLEVEE